MESPPFNDSPSMRRPHKASMSGIAISDGPAAMPVNKCGCHMHDCMGFGFVAARQQLIHGLSN